MISDKVHGTATTFDECLEPVCSQGQLFLHCFIVSSTLEAIQKHNSTLERIQKRAHDIPTRNLLALHFLC